MRLTQTIILKKKNNQIDSKFCHFSKSRLICPPFSGFKTVNIYMYVRDDNLFFLSKNSSFIIAYLAIFFFYASNNIFDVYCVWSSRAFSGHAHNSFWETYNDRIIIFLEYYFPVASEPTRTVKITKYFNKRFMR